VSEGDFKCPYCKCAIYDEDRDYCDGDSHETECPECAKKFSIYGYFSPHYRAEGDCRLTGEMPHRLEKDWLKLETFGQQYTCAGCGQEYYDPHLAGGKYEKLKEGEYIIIEDSK
jgi:hypothetical protein